MASRGNYQIPPHLKLIDELVVNVALSPTPRFLIVEVPPRHGKTELISHYTPAWYLGRRPDHRIMLVTHEADFAHTLGRKARDVIDEYGKDLYDIELSTRSSAAGRWDLEPPHQGGLLAAGMGGSVIGRGGHLIIIDDPVKGWEEVQSDTYRQKQWEWYSGTLRHRLEPGGSIILLMTRWHEDDLAGRLLGSNEDPESLEALMEEGEEADQWEEIRLPALAEPVGDEEYAAYREDPDGWKDRLGRSEGEALWPERYKAPALRRIRRVNPIVFEGLFQGRPTAREGEMFKTHWWGSTRQVPHTCTEWVRRWDLAGTEKKAGNDPDWSAGVLMTRHRDGRFFIADARRIRGSDLEVERFMAATAAEDNRRLDRRVPVRMEQEPGSGGKKWASHIRREVLPGEDFKAVPSTGKKEVRAKPYSSHVEAGNVFLLEGAWNDDFIEEHRQFPRGRHDDWVDAASLAIEDLTGGPVRRSSYSRTGARRGRR